MKRLSSHTQTLSETRQSLAARCRLDGARPVDWLRWPAHHYLGEPRDTWFDDGDTVGDVVTWRNFRNGHRDWDLSAIGPFVFDRTQHEKTLRATAMETWWQSVGRVGPPRIGLRCPSSARRCSSASEPTASTTWSTFAGSLDLNPIS